MFYTLLNNVQYGFFCAKYIKINVWHFRVLDVKFSCHHFFVNLFVLLFDVHIFFRYI